MMHPATRSQGKNFPYFAKLHVLFPSRSVLMEQQYEEALPWWNFVKLQEVIFCVDSKTTVYRSVIELIKAIIISKDAKTQKTTIDFFSCHVLFAREEIAGPLDLTPFSKADVLFVNPYFVCVSAKISNICRTNAESKFFSCFLIASIWGLSEANFDWSQ